MPKKKVSKTKSTKKTSKNRLYEHRAKIFVGAVLFLILASLLIIAFVGIEDLFMFIGGDSLNELGNYVNNPTY